MRLGPAAGWTATLSHQELGQAGDLAQTELEARRIGGMLREAGINWNLAPVVDVGYNPANPVIVGVGRSFGANPQIVAAQARAYITGMHAAGVLTALKHFPGHGSSIDDSHAGFVDVTETARPDVELVPYRLLLAEGLVDAVMTAHVFNRHLDTSVPATLVALAGPLVGFSPLRRQERGLTDAVTKRGKTIAANLAAAGKSALATNDDLALNIFVKEAMHDEDVAYVVFTDEKGIVHAHSDVTAIGRPVVRPPALKPASQQALVQTYKRGDAEIIDISVP